MAPAFPSETDRITFDHWLTTEIFFADHPKAASVDIPLRIANPDCLF
jgi:hypothetical protein